MDTAPARFLDVPRPRPVAAVDSRPGRYRLERPMTRPMPTVQAQRLMDLLRSFGVKRTEVRVRTERHRRSEPDHANPNRRIHYVEYGDVSAYSRTPATDAAIIAHRADLVAEHYDVLLVWVRSAGRWIASAHSANTYADPQIIAYIDGKRIALAPAADLPTPEEHR